MNYYLLVKILDGKIVWTSYDEGFAKHYHPADPDAAAFERDSLKKWDCRSAKGVVGTYYFVELEE